MATKGFLGIDAGTQGLSLIFTDEDLRVLAVGEGTYDMVPDLEEGCYEQDPQDWILALQSAAKELHAKLSDDIEVLAIGISGQMHGEVLSDEQGVSLGPARLWCDSRNEEQAEKLTQSFGVKMPKRITSARWFWTLQNQAEKANCTARMTTPAGWIAFQLTGDWNLGIGDASGMFPIDQRTLGYDQSLLEKFADVTDSSVALETLLPAVRTAGQDGGVLSANGASLLGLVEGIPVAPAEGDQPAALAGSLIAKAGMVSISFGTSVCANSVGDRAFQGVSQAVDHFCAVDGKPINMVWLRNGTTYMNTVVEMFGTAIDGDRATAFQSVMPQVLEAPADCGGILALPFMDDEPGLGVESGGTAMLYGLNPSNANCGNTVKASLLSTMFNLKMGSEVLDRQGYPRTELVLTGGLTRTPELGQVLSDVFEAPVTLLSSAEEGTAWGAALLAKYRHKVISGSSQSWSEFVLEQPQGDVIRFEPNAENAKAYSEVYQRYKQLVQSREHLV